MFQSRIHIFYTKIRYKLTFLNKEKYENIFSAIGISLN